MDGLSGAACVIAVVDISAKIFSSCQRYAKGVKDARKDIQRLRDGVTSLQDVLTDIADLEQESDVSKRTVFARLTQHNGPVQQCEKELRSLLSQLDVGEGDDKMRQFGTRALKWPFSNKDVEKRLAEINTLKATFTLALTSDALSLTRAMNENIQTLGAGIAELQLEQKTLATSSKQRELRSWLAAPDSSSNHNAACKLHQENTGNWLLESTTFQEWKTQSRSFLWLHGIPGCGKSILCSTIIEDVKSQYKLNNAVFMAYYYFSFTDSDKQKHDKFVRSLIEQFAWKSSHALTCLESLYVQCENGTQQPTQGALESTFRKMLKYCGESFIIIDALDECSPREDLLTFLGTLSLEVDRLHILVTSRRERDIEQALESATTDDVSLQGSEIQNDMHSYIIERLGKSPKLKRWPARVRGDIEKTLTRKSRGMFRWVVCQMDVLEKCVTVAHLRKALECLPHTLDDTYDRILRSINSDEIYRRDAFRIFQWLVYATRPLLLEEVAEIIAIDTVESQFDPENRLSDPRDLLTICSTLITTVTLKTEKDVGESDSSDVPESENVHVKTEIYLAHFSIKEYLTSDRIQTKPNFQYDVRSTAQDEITQACLIYLLYFQDNGLGDGNLHTFPLFNYAATQWCEHYRLAKESISLTTLAMELFEGPAFLVWTMYRSEKPKTVNPPLQYACQEGLKPVVALLLDKWTNEDAEATAYYRNTDLAPDVSFAFMEHYDNVKARKGFLNDSLKLACRGGYRDTVACLLDKQADVDAVGYCDAVQVALRAGFEDIVALILGTVSKKNLAGEAYMDVLRSASATGNREIISYLLDKDLVVDVYGSAYANAIGTASRNGHLSIVDLLLKGRGDIAFSTADQNFSRRSLNRSLKISFSEENLSSLG